MAVHAFLRSLFPAAARKRRSADQGSGPAIVRLEDRVLLSGVSYSFSSTSKLLTLTGGSGNDGAWVDYYGSSSLKVTTQTNGASATARYYSRSSVSLVRFYGNAGNDLFVNNTSIRSDAYGGSGGDRLYGGSNRDTFYGGSGNDDLIGRDGDDSLYGETDNDRVWGGGNNDRLEGGSGNDQLMGESGNDSLYGGSGDDSLWGGSGNDRLYGDSGSDRLMGDSGHDRLFGGSGTDYLWGGDGNDGLFGGVGSWQDRLNGGTGNDRLLTYGSDVIADRASNDAQLRFVDGNIKWNDLEIERLDEYGFAVLQSRANGSTRPLRDSRFSDPLTFRKQTVIESDASIAGLNTEYGAEYRYVWDYLKFTWKKQLVRGGYRIIDIKDWNSNSISESKEAGEIAIHEVAHNWDSREELATIGVGGLWDQFVAISGWSTSSSAGKTKSTDGKWYYKSSTGSDFYRSYGKTNPREDWTTAWEGYFDNWQKYGVFGLSGGFTGKSSYTSNAKLLAKYEVVNAVLDRMSRLA